MRKPGPKSGVYGAVKGNRHGYLSMFGYFGHGFVFF